jgi:hypothetical protein
MRRGERVREREGKMEKWRGKGREGARKTYCGKEQRRRESNS